MHLLSRHVPAAQAAQHSPHRVTPKTRPFTFALLGLTFCSPEQR